MSAEHGLTPAERALLFMACAGHAVAQCPVCSRRYTRSAIGADLLGSSAVRCPTCRLDLTGSIREHLLSCSAAVALEAQELRGRSAALQDGSREARKRAEQTTTEADHIAREIEAGGDPHVAPDDRAPSRMATRMRPMEGAHERCATCGRCRAHWTCSFLACVCDEKCRCGKPAVRIERIWTASWRPVCEEHWHWHRA